MRHGRRKKWLLSILLFIGVGVVLAAGGLFTYYKDFAKEDTHSAHRAESNHHSSKEGVHLNADHQNSSTKIEPVTYYQDADSVEEKVGRVLESMTLEEKIGQMLVVGFQSTESDEHIERMIRDYHAGGVILFDRNMENPSQVAKLTNQLQKIAYSSSLQIPLTFSVDQEGGAIIRMKEYFSSLPSQQALGEKGDKKAISKLAVRTGQQLAAMGFTINFAPVLDLSDTDSRSFGTDPLLTGEYGSEVISGLVAGGVTATVKHFPGNGRSNVDPHEDTSAVDADQLDLENNDIYPFKKVIQELNHDDFFVMVTHIKYPAYDKEHPASISPVIMQDLLRDQLGYTGIVVTDDLEMGAVNKYFTYEDLGCQAVSAGADMLLVCHTEESQKQVFNGILEGVQSGEIPISRVDEAVKRILSYKYQHITTIEADEEEAAKIVGDK